MLFWLHFRLVQTYRLLKTTGWMILLVLVFATAGLWSQGLHLLTQLNAWQIGLIAHIGIGVLHLRRTDGPFLRQSQRFLPGLLGVDYGLILLPFALFLGLSGHILAAFALSTAIIWAFIPLRRQIGSSISKVLPLPFIPPLAFEWYLIIRSQGILLLLGVLLQLGSCWHFGFFIAGSAVVLLALPAGFDPVGPHHMLPRSRRELMRRCRALATILHLFLLPGYGLLLLFQRPVWWLVPYVFAASEIFLLLCLLYKINAWQPGRTRAYNATILSLSWIFMLLPGLILIPLGQIFWFLYQVDHRFFTQDAHKVNGQKPTVNSQNPT